MTRKNGKPCNRCGTSDWYDGGGCRQCIKENGERRRREKPDEIRETQKLYRLNNSQEVKDRKQKWRSDNREKEYERHRRWADENKERNQEHKRKWKQNNRTKIRAKNHRRRTRKTKAGGSYTAAEWKALCKQYGNRCLCCGKKTKLTADHVIPVTSGGTSDISNIQPLCMKCNQIKNNKTIDYRTKPGIKRWMQNRLI